VIAIERSDRLVIAPSQRRRTVLGVIRSAQQDLVLSIFRCDDQLVLDALIEAVSRGVRVRVLMTGRAKGSARDLDEAHAQLLRHGVAVRRFQDDVKYHAKFVVADDHRALVTSSNFTEKCFARTSDFVVVTRDTATVDALRQMFESDWAARCVRPSTAMCERLIVGPDQRPRERMAELIGSATRRIRLLDAKLTDPRILALLDARRAADIEVDVLDNRRVGPWESHGKLLLIDEGPHAVAVIGSLALSPASLDVRRELAVVIRDGVAIRQIEQHWQSLTERPATQRSPSSWQTGTPVFSPDQEVWA
jgi:phosphatidylserine/phosphatidylglycerophosphate/cardiolipin synthase-like enzyme